MAIINKDSFWNKHQKLVIVIIGVVFVFANLVISNNTRNFGKRFVFWSDALGYYTYLPSIIILNDINKGAYGEICPTTKIRVNKYSSGVAILELPFFLMAHTVAQFTESNPNGLSETYEFCITMGTITYAFLGLLLMYFVLRRHVRKWPAIFALGTIYFGTNLYYYTIGESGMSHAYSFFAISWFIWVLHHFLEKPTWKNSLQMGMAVGLAILIRPTNILILILPFMLGIKHWSELGRRVNFLFKQPYTYLAAITAFFIFVPQMIYWKQSTGSFIYYSYPGETFSNIANPQIGKILFGNVSGLFAYSPLLLLFIPGLITMIKRKHTSLVIAIVLIFCCITFLNASWWIPTFDCSFGHRAFIEYYPLLIIPIAFFFDAFNRLWKTIVMGTLLLFFIFINIRMSYLYKKYPCWKEDFGYTWTWDNVAYVTKVVFYINPMPKEHFRNIEK